MAGAGEPPKEGDHGGEEDGEEEEEEEKEEDEDEEARSVGGEGDLGNVRARFRVDWDNNLVVTCFNFLQKDSRCIFRASDNC